MAAKVGTSLLVSDEAVQEAGLHSMLVRLWRAGITGPTAWAIARFRYPHA